MKTIKNAFANTFAGRGTNHEKMIVFLFFLPVIITLTLLSSCKKELKPLVRGGTYRVQSNVFNVGTWQPLDTLYAYSIYFNNSAGLWYCQCLGPGVNKPIAAPGAKIDSLDNTVEWFIPTDDLK